MANSPSEEQIYCSLDLETTGFDPTKDEILEVGFVFFSLGDKGPVVHKEWSQIFRPVKKEVHPKIFGLTGINPAELDQAPQFSEFREFLQKELGDAILVGHSISFDVRFLEAFGLQLSARYIDTLDLVQFILPTHHSYNLENLMHTFRVPHPKAHRAAADARASIEVLVQLLRTYQSFPPELKRQIQIWAGRGGFSWTELLSIALIPQPRTEEVSKSIEPGELSGDPPPQGAILSFPVGSRPEHMLLRHSGTLAVVPHTAQVLSWWKQGLAAGIVGADESFDPKKFEKLLNLPELNPDQIKFILKVLVWQHTNWQTGTILDLNLSFFGGQYRSLITGRFPAMESSEPILCCSHKTFLELRPSDSVAARTLLIYDLGNFERSVMLGIGEKASWGHIIYLLKSIYNPEMDGGNADLSDEVIAALGETDLFFALVAMYAQKHFYQALHVTYEQLEAESFHFNKLAAAAEHYRSQLQRHNKKLKNPAISRFSTALGWFFQEQSGRVKWIESGDSRCAFYNYPLDIIPLVKKVLQSYPRNSFVDDCGNAVVRQYLQARLGLENYELLSQQLAAPKANVSCMVSMRRADEQTVIDLLAPDRLPALVLFDKTEDLKEFYKRNYVALKKYASVFAQDYSGGGNKMFRNFSIKPASIILATPSYVRKTITSGLSVKSLIWTDFSLLQDDSRHPYEQALIREWAAKGVNLPEVRAIQALSSLLKLCFSDQLQEVALFAPGLKESQQNLLRQSLKQIEFLKIS